MFTYTFHDGLIIIRLRLPLLILALLRFIIHLKYYFNYGEKIIVENNIKSKESYYILCEKDKRLPKTPEDFFKERFMGWVDYLSIENIYYDLETCKNKVNSYLLLYPQLKNYYLDLYKLSNELCAIDPLFPPCELWIDYYKVNKLVRIIKISHFKNLSEVSSMNKTTKVFF